MINTTDKYLGRPINIKEKKILIVNRKNKRRGITTNNINIKGSIRSYHTKHYANKFKKLD